MQTRHTNADGLTAQAGTEEPGSRRWRVVLAFVLVVALVGSVVAGAWILLGGGGSPRPDDFAGKVSGMPVVSIADAQALIQSDAVDGRALAVEGWWIQSMIPSCPAPGRRIGPLEQYCMRNIFSSLGFQAMTCLQLQDQSTSCGSNQPPAGAAVMSPVLVNDTSSWNAMPPGDAAPWQNGVPVVLIGHAADPRFWQCPPDTRQSCRHQFVVDRVAWIAGQPVPATVTQTDLTPNLSVDQAAMAAGIETDLITVALVRATDAWNIDPRLHLVGEDLVWVLRSLRADQPATDDPTRVVDVAVVDDQTGKVLASLPLELGDAQPALVQVQATVVGDCCSGIGGYPFFGIERADGTGLVESMVNGSATGAGGDPRTQFHSGSPAVLDPGAYIVYAWASALVHGEQSGPRLQECSTQITVEALAEIRLEAQFPSDGACSFVDPTFNDDLF